MKNTCTSKNIRKFYGKITGNQLPVRFPLFFTSARKHFQEPGTYGSKKTCSAFGHIAFKHILISKNVLQADGRKNNGKWTGSWLPGILP